MNEKPVSPFNLNGTENLPVFPLQSETLFDDFGLEQKLLKNSMPESSGIDCMPIEVAATSKRTVAGTIVNNELIWPPGFAKILAQYIFDSSYSPVMEVAIAATLGVLAGVCGRAYRTPSGKDLALYIILVARSGIGKDGIHDGIPKLIELAGVPLADKFIKSEDFASGPALHKAVLKEPGFLNLQGEFGRKLKRMANPSDAPMQMLRTVMTDAFGKRRLGGKSYSDSEKSLPSVDWPALSFLGETTPNTFLESLTPDMMEDGFMSRFLIISHDGDRPLPNEEAAPELSQEEQERWRNLLTHTFPYQTPINMPKATVVEYANNDAYDKLKNFELLCIGRINATTDESERQMWNRAHLKALKIASLLAVADHHQTPKIGIGHATWAISTVRSDMAVFQSHRKNGNIGIDDHTREHKLLAIIREYLINGAGDSYNVPSEIKKEGIIPRKYLQQRISCAAAFRNHKLGATPALDLTIRSLIDNGYLKEVEKLRMLEKHNFHGKCFLVLELPQ